MHKRACPPTCATPLTCEAHRRDHARLAAVLAALGELPED